MGGLPAGLLKSINYYMYAKKYVIKMYARKFFCQNNINGEENEKRCRIKSNYCEQTISHQTSDLVYINIGCSVNNKRTKKKKKKT